MRGNKAPFLGMMGFLLLANTGLFAEGLPPLGQRKYILGDELKPTKIEKGDAKTTKTFLRDPILKSSGPEPLVEKAGKKVEHRPAKTKAPTSAVSQVQFKAMPIAGRLTRPRVEFHSDQPSLGRADEPNRIDYMERLSQTVEESEKGL